MTRGTTPTYTIKIKGSIDFSEVDIFYVTVKQMSVSITHTSEDDSVTLDAENNKVGIALTQEETLSFKEGTADLQIRGKFSDGTAFATVPKRVPVNRVLYEEVI